MEDPLDLDAAPPAPARPVVCRDERPVQLVAEARPALPPRPRQPARRDAESARAGTACLAVAFAPHAGWRHVIASPRRAKRAFAGWVRELVDVHFPAAETIRLVVDTLAPHTPAVLYDAVPPAQAPRIARKLEWHAPPKHGSWLNMVEIELRVLANACLDRRIPGLPTLARESAAYAARRNAARATVRWRFTTPDARAELDHLSPLPNPA